MTPPNPPPKSGPPDEEWPTQDPDPVVVSETPAGAAVVSDDAAVVSNTDQTVVSTDDATVVQQGDQTVVSTDDATVVSQAPPPRAPVAAPAPRGEPDDPIGRGLILGLGVLAVVAIAALAIWLLTRKDNNTTTTSTTTSALTTTAAAANIAVPTLTGLTEEQALVQLGNAGLSPNVQRLTTGPADGLVASQSPPAGSQIAPGSLVTIDVHRAAAGTPVTPPKAATTTPAKTTTPAATTTTAPAAKTSTVPDVVGKAEQDAVQTMNDAGVVPSIVFVPADTPLGTVQSQAKDAGTQIPADSPVQITVSRGPGDKPDETVPDVIGKTLPDALSTINAQQLRLIYLKRPVQAQSEAGKVVKQTPLSGAKAPQNAQVLVYVGAFGG